MTTRIMCASLALLGFACAAPGAGSTDGTKSVEELGIDEEHIAEDSVTGDVHVNLAAIDSETLESLPTDEETLASVEEDGVSAILGDPDVQSLLPELIDAIALDDRSTYDALLETLDSVVLDRHDFEAFYTSGVMIADGSEDEESLAARVPRVGDCFSYLVPDHGRDRTHFCEEDRTQCHSARHFPCNGDHTNGTFYGYAQVTRGSSTVCELVRTVRGAVTCHGRQQTRICGPTRTGCGAEGAKTSGTWSHQRLLRQNACVAPC